MRTLRGMVGLPSWAMMTDDQKSEAVRDVLKDAHKAGRSELLQAHSELVGTGPNLRYPGTLAPKVKPASVSVPEGFQLDAH